ncbi:MAG: hypothetical protein KGD60_10700 [Candidatus Thorarchaeota archaeon]|nr:hypothetical protein [Candidatus Thorarchaeota archaeon]
MRQEEPSVGEKKARTAGDTIPLEEYRRKLAEKQREAKVLVICRYCGSKTEQGITKCQNCGAEL